MDLPPEKVIRSAAGRAFIAMRALVERETPAPLFHAASKAVRRELYAFYAEFVAAYREASEKFRAGKRTVTFPLGSFPPALPFVAG